MLRLSLIVLYNFCCSSLFAIRPFKSLIYSELPYKQVSKLLEEKRIPLAEEEFYCRGSFSMIHRGRPNADDCNAAADFARKILSQEG